MGKCMITQRRISRLLLVPCKRDTACKILRSSITETYNHHVRLVSYPSPVLQLFSSLVVLSHPGVREKVAYGIRTTLPIRKVTYLVDPIPAEYGKSRASTSVGRFSWGKKMFAVRTLRPLVMMVLVLEVT